MRFQQMLTCRWDSRAAHIRDFNTALLDAGASR